MSCLLTLGRNEGCKDNRGGLKNIYFANYEAGLETSATFDADGQITAFASPLTLYKYEIRSDENVFDEANPNDESAGTSFWEGSLTIALKKMTVADRAELIKASRARPHVFVEDYNGIFRLMGIELGCTVSVGTASGGSMCDFSGYRLDITSKEVEMAHFVDPTIIDDTTNTTVVVGS